MSWSIYIITSNIASIYDQAQMQALLIRKSSILMNINKRCNTLNHVIT